MEINIWLKILIFGLLIPAYLYMVKNNLYGLWEKTHDILKKVKFHKILIPFVFLIILSFTGAWIQLIADIYCIKCKKGE